MKNFLTPLLIGCTLTAVSVPTLAEKKPPEPVVLSEPNPAGQTQPQVVAIDGLQRELSDFLTAWNAARNAADEQKLAEFYHPDDGQNLLSRLDTKRLANATVTLDRFQETKPGEVRLRYTRSWTGRAPGKATAAMRLVKLDGRWVITATQSRVVAKSSRMDQQVRVVAAPYTPPAPPPLTEVSTSVGRAKLVQLPYPVVRVAIGDPSVADFTMVSPRELYVLGKSVGSTNLILWDKSGASTVLDAVVTVDLAPLTASLRRAAPNESDIRVEPASGSILLTGSVADVLVSAAVANVADAYVQNLNRYLKSAGGSSDGASGAGGSASSSGMRVVNLLRVRDAQQVMLDVRIAEISRTLLERLGVNFNRPSTTSGSVTWGIVSNFIAEGSTSSLNLLFKNSGITVDIDAEKGDGLVKILAEPTIVAMSGKEASFLSGGKIYIPVTQPQGGGTTLEERSFGIGLKFLPTVLDAGRISLKVEPEVSELAFARTEATSIPTISTRTVSTTVQLRDGESLVIGGLIKNNIEQSVKAIPLLGELPILGALFRSTEFVNNKTELLVVVSPSLVQATKVKPQLPTDNFVPPSRSELFLEGKLEGQGGGNAR